MPLRSRCGGSEWEAVSAEEFRCQQCGHGTTIATLTVGHSRNPLTRWHSLRGQRSLDRHDDETELYAHVQSGAAKDVPRIAAAIGLGIAAMASTDIPYTALGVSDPRTWGAKGWLSDLIPHLLYGLATAAVFDDLHHTTR